MKTLLCILFLLFFPEFTFCQTLNLVPTKVVCSDKDLFVRDITDNIEKVEVLRSYIDTSTYRIIVTSKDGKFNYDVKLKFNRSVKEELFPNKISDVYLYSVFPKSSNVLSVISTFKSLSEIINDANVNYRITIKTNLLYINMTFN